MDAQPGDLADGEPSEGEVELATAGTPVAKVGPGRTKSAAGTCLICQDAKTKPKFQCCSSCDKHARAAEQQAKDAGRGRCFQEQKANPLSFRRLVVDFQQACPGLLPR